jgi:hypothetical protein
MNKLIGTQGGIASQFLALFKRSEADLQIGSILE